MEGHDPKVDFEREIRFAVVMYGGVSLAVYMNGATKELLNMVRATAVVGDTDGAARVLVPGAKLSAVQRIYRKLAKLSASERAPEDPNVLRQRFVIDILSGTSAGGINAVFLAKALANGESIDGLARLWEEGAAIGELIDDNQSRAALNLPSKLKPRADLETTFGKAKDARSLLSSLIMYDRLVSAFDGMSAPPGDGPLVPSVDLYVTTTDHHGHPIQLKLGGGELANEKRHRKAFHLVFDPDIPENHFAKQDNPFLAFTCRCTSSFPVAFEPMRYQAAVDAIGDDRLAKNWARYEPHFLEYTQGDAARVEAAKDRPFTDGGILNNKPFSHAISAMSDRYGSDSGVVERKLVFIEPDPELPVYAEKLSVPNAVETALSVADLPRYETIREELLRVRDRNRLVSKITSVVSGVNEDFALLGAADASRLGALAKLLQAREQFEERDLSEVVATFGPAYGGYHRLKVGQLTDELTNLVGARFGIVPDSDEFQSLRSLLRTYRDAHYDRKKKGSSPGKESEFSFLLGYDLGYRIRRLSFVIGQLSRVRALRAEDFAKERATYRSIFGPNGAEQVSFDDLCDAVERLRYRLSACLQRLRRGRASLARQVVSAEDLAANADERVRFRAVVTQITQPSDEGPDRVVDEIVTPPEAQVPLERLLQWIQLHVTPIREEASLGVRGILTGLGVVATDFGRPTATPAWQTTPSALAAQIAHHYYAWYELYDSMLFSITYGSEVGEELAPVEAIRISPFTKRDDHGFAIPWNKLVPTGKKLGHFGAFLDRSWRAQDILLGRLNAAEKLASTILAGTVHDAATRSNFVRELQEAILAEVCANGESVVASVLPPGGDEAAKLARLRDEGFLQSDLPPKYAVGYIARCATMLGRILEGIGLEGTEKLTTGLVWGGRVLAGIAEIAVPEHWWGLVLRLWYPRLLLLGGALAIIGTLTGSSEVSMSGWLLLLALAVFGTLVLLLRVWILGWLKNGRVRWALSFTLGAILAALLGVGAVYSKQAAKDIYGYAHGRVVALRAGR